jgi:hypothetical protein
MMRLKDVVLMYSTASVPAGITYRFCSIKTAAVVPIVQHASLDDCVYVCLNPSFSLIVLSIMTSSHLLACIVFGSSVSRSSKGP